MDPEAEQQIRELQVELQATHSLLAEQSRTFHRRVSDLEREAGATHVIVKELQSLLHSRVGLLDRIVDQNSKTLAGQDGALARILQILEKNP